MAALSRRGLPALFQVPLPAHTVPARAVRIVAVVRARLGVALAQPEARAPPEVLARLAARVQQAGLAQPEARALLVVLARPAPLARGALELRVRPEVQAAPVQVTLGLARLKVVRAVARPPLEPPARPAALAEARAEGWR